MNLSRENVPRKNHPSIHASQKISRWKKREMNQNEKCPGPIRTITNSVTLQSVTKKIAAIKGATSRTAHAQNYWVAKR